MTDKKKKRRVSFNINTCHLKAATRKIKPFCRQCIDQDPTVQNVQSDLGSTLSVQ